MAASKPFTIDSNILIYAGDRSDPQKHRFSNQIVQSLMFHHAWLPLQCLNEFYKVTTQKGHLPAFEAEKTVRDLVVFVDVVAPEIEDTFAAMALQQSHRIQYFDALLLAVASRAGCTTIFSEDMQDKRTYGSITVRNPFLMSSTDLDALLDLSER
jgi:predicted nucleic acid-binding protein